MSDDRYAALAAAFDALADDNAELRTERDALAGRQIPDGWEVEWEHVCGPDCPYNSDVPRLVPAPSPDTEEGT